VVANRREHLEPRVQGPERNLEAHLVVARGRAAVGDRVAAQHRRLFRADLGLQAPLGADAQGIELAPAHVAEDQVPDDLVEELAAGVDGDVLLGAQGQGPGLEGGGVHVAAGVHRDGDDRAAQGLLEPGDAEGRVEAAGECEQNGTPARGG